MAARRRRVCRARRGSAPSSAGASRVSTAPTRSSSTRTSGCSRRWTARRSGRAGRRCCTRRSRSCRLPGGDAGRNRPEGLRACARPPLPRAQALDGAALVRRRGPAGLIREHVRLAQLFAALVEAEPGWEVVAPHPFSTVCFRHVEADNDEIARAATATGELFVASAWLRGRAMIRLAIGNEQTTEDDIRRSWEVLRAVRAVSLRPLGNAIFDLPLETLIDWDRQSAAQMLQEVDALVGNGFAERWDTRHSGTSRRSAPRSPKRRAGGAVERDLRAPARYHRRSLVPRAGAVETLAGSPRAATSSA